MNGGEGFAAYSGVFALQITCFLLAALLMNRLMSGFRVRMQSSLAEVMALAGLVVARLFDPLEDRALPWLMVALQIVWFKKICAWWIIGALPGRTEEPVLPLYVIEPELWRQRMLPNVSGCSAAKRCWSAGRAEGTGATALIRCGDVVGVGARSASVRD